MDHTPNEPDAAAHDQLEENIKAVDEGIRASYSAASVEDILPVASRDLAAIGVNLPDETLAAYAQSVADGTDFEFTLP
jgi:hypothetical protein